MTKEAIRAAMRAAVEKAVYAEANPAAAVLGKFPGRSSTGTVTVWVDAIGRMERLELAPGTVQEGDEDGVAAAVLEAYVAAVKASSVIALAGIEEWQQHQAKGRRRPAADDEPDGPTITQDSF